MERRIEDRVACKEGPTRTPSKGNDEGSKEERRSRGEKRRRREREEWRRRRGEEGGEEEERRRGLSTRLELLLSLSPLLRHHRFDYDILHPFSYHTMIS